MLFIIGVFLLVGVVIALGTALASTLFHPSDYGDNDWFFDKWEDGP